MLATASALRKLAYAPATQIDCCQMEYAYQWSPTHLASYPLFYVRNTLSSHCSCPQILNAWCPERTLFPNISVVASLTANASTCLVCVCLQDDPAVRARDFVMASCTNATAIANANAAGSGCVTTTTGGNFTGGNRRYG